MSGHGGWPRASARGPTRQYYSIFTPKVDSSVLSRESEIFFWICCCQWSQVTESSSIIHDCRPRQFQDSPMVSSCAKATSSAHYRVILFVCKTGNYSLMVLEDYSSFLSSGFRYVAESPYCRCLSDLKYCDFFLFLFFILSRLSFDRLQAIVVNTLTPTSSFLGMMEKTEMCGSLQQPFYYRLRFTAHVTFMPVPATCTVFVSTPDRRCSSDLKYCDFLLFLHLFFPFVVDRLRAFVVNTLTPTSSFLGMMEKTEMCGSLQQPFYYRLRFTAHVTFMPVPATCTVLVSKKSPISCA